MKYINLKFLNKFKEDKRRRLKKVQYYELHGMGFKEMERYILHPDRDDPINKINHNLPSKGDVYTQLTYYFRAFSKSQIFLDANHRTGFFCLKQIAKGKGYEIDMNVDEVQSLGDYLKSHFYVHQGEMKINLRQKDEVYEVILEWLKRNLDVR